MTLKIRNRILRIFFLTSILFIFISTATFFYVLLKGNLIPPPELRVPAFLNSLPFAKQNFAATLISFFPLLIYVPIVLLVIFRFFENTRSTELIFFAAFLFGCLCEVARYFIIIYGLWQSYTNLLIFLGDFVLFGRILAPLSFVCASIFSETEQLQDVERNFTMMTAVSFVLALVIPLNTAQITSTGLITEGFMGILRFSRLTMIALASLSFFIRFMKHSNKEYLYMISAIIPTFIGYIVLTYADNFFFLILGTVLLYGGTHFYIRTLHRMYLWT